MAQIKPESSFVSVEGTRWGICATLKDWRDLKDVPRAGTSPPEESGSWTKGCIKSCCTEF